MFKKPYDIPLIIYCLTHPHLNTFIPTIIITSIIYITLWNFIIEFKARHTERSDVSALSVVFQLVEEDGKFRPPKKEIVT